MYSQFGTTVRILSFLLPWPEFNPGLGTINKILQAEWRELRGRPGNVLLTNPAGVLMLGQAMIDVAS